MSENSKHGQPLVSVVISTRNQGKFIAETLDSVLNQDYPNIELIVYDGSSTDETVEILKNYGDRIWWKSEVDKGEYHGYNKGLKQAKGEILKMIPSDDLLEPGAVSFAVNYLLKHEEIDLIYGEGLVIDEQGQVIKTNTCLCGFSVPALVRHTSGCIPWMTVFFRQHLLETVGIFREDLDNAGDYEFYLRAALRGGRIVYVPKVLGRNRMQRLSKSITTSDRHWAQIWEVSKTYGSTYDLGVLWLHQRLLKLVRKVAKKLLERTRIGRKLLGKRQAVKRALWRARTKQYVKFLQEKENGLQ